MGIKESITIYNKKEIEMKTYVKPEITIFELETTVSILSASVGNGGSNSISDDGSFMDFNGDFSTGDAGESGAAKEHSLWDLE